MSTDVDVSNEDRFYRRGLVLGFTMAEIFLLIIFALLLLVASLLKERENEIHKLEKDLVVKESRIKWLVDQSGNTDEIMQKANGFDDIFNELVLVREDEPDNTDADQKVAALKEKMKDLATKASYFDEVAEDIVDDPKLLEEPEEALKSVQDHLAAAESCNERLEDAELDQQKIAAFDELYDDLVSDKGDKTDSIPKDQKVAALKEKMKDLATKASYFDEVAEDIVDDPKLLEEPEEALKSVQDHLAAAESFKERLEEVGYNKEEIDEFFKNTFKELNDAKQKEKRVKGQLRNLKTRCGTEKPACWAHPDTGKPEYIFRVYLTSTGVIVHDNAIPHRIEEQKELPLQGMLYDEELSLSKFLVITKPLFAWSDEEDCRFFVRIEDLTEPMEKGIYKRHLRIVGQHFYYFEPPVYASMNRTNIEHQLGMGGTD